MIDQGYLLSLPERAIRSTAALLGGTTLLLTENLLPDVVRNTITFQITIGDLQKFLITRLGQVPLDESQSRMSLSETYMRKKIVGSSIEAIGLLKVRFSPVWVFAIVSDAAGGSKVFFERLVQNLKENDVISHEDNPQDITALFEALQSAALESARAIDTPPLSGDELAAVASNLGDSYGQLFDSRQPILDRFESILNRMDEVVRLEGVSFEKLSGIMSVQASNLAKSSWDTGKALGTTGADLLGEQILESYARTLDNISREGVNAYLSDHITPYIQTALAHWDPDRSTWTEEFFAMNLDGDF